MIISRTASRRQTAGHVAAAWISALAVILGTHALGTPIAANIGLTAGGLLIMLGVTLSWQQWGRGPASALAPLLLLLAGGGYVLAGLNPADTRLGAVLAQLPGHDVGLGAGGIERVAAIPLLAWIVIAAITLTGVRRPPPRRHTLELDALSSGESESPHHAELSADSLPPRRP